MKFQMANPERGAIRAYVPGGSSTASPVSRVSLPREGITQLPDAHKSQPACSALLSGCEHSLDYVEDVS